jgi:hypothetical protein
MSRSLVARHYKPFLGLNKTVRQPFPKPKTIPDHVKSSDGSSPDNGALREAKTHYDPSGRLTSHTIEAHGLKGFKRTPWRKTFKHADHLNDWAEKNDAEVHGTRDLEAAKHGNLSPGVSEAYAAPNTGNTNVAHKGYLITPNPIYGEYHVSKDGHHITTQKSLEQAKKAIDSLSEAYAAPNTGNNNYAQNLPASISTTKARIKAKLDKRDQASIADTMAEGTGSNLVIIHPEHQDKYPHLKGKRIYKAGPAENMVHHTLGRGKFQNVFVHHSTHRVDMETIPVKHLKTPTQKDRNAWFSSKNVAENTDKDGGAIKRAYDLGVDHGLDGKPVQAPADINHAAAYMDGHKAGTKRRIAVLQHDRIHDEVITSIDQLQHILDEAAIVEGKHSAYKEGYAHGLRLSEMPRDYVEDRHGTGTHHHYMKGVDAGRRARNPSRPKSLLSTLLNTEELKVGDDDQEQKKVRGTNTVNGKLNSVKRKYLGNSRGTTKTGKPAHAIDVQPVIGADNRNHNKTTPSGQKKRT